MSGFFVSNSFGTFKSEAATKKFNADMAVGSGSPHFINIPNAPSRGTFFDLVQGHPSVTGLSYTDNWAFNNWGSSGNNWTGLDAIKDGSRVNWMYEDEVVELFSNYNGDLNSGDKVLLYENDAFKYAAHPKTTVQLRVRYITNDKGTQDAYDYVVNIKKNGTDGETSVPTACNDSNNPCFTDYVRQDHNGVAEFHVYLDGSNGDYLEIDMNKNSSVIANSVFKTSCGTWKKVNAGGSDDPANHNIDRVEIQLREVKWNPVPGCTDGAANNPNPNATVDDGSCTYTTTSISSFTAAPTNPKVGDTVTLAWNLSNTNFTEVKILVNGNNIMPSNKKGAKTSSITVTPSSAGTLTYTMEVTWNKPNAGKPTAVLNVPVVSAVSYVTCTDPNRNKDGNQECADCKSGYYLGTDGLCTNCELSNPDPYRDMDATTGQCTGCMDGYVEHTDGTCQKVGCMTYEDGTSAEDDYNYDPDAVVNDSSMCQGADPIYVPEDIDCEVSEWSEWSAWSDAATSSGTRTRTRTIVTAQSGGGAGCPSLEETETGVVDPTTGEVTITTQGGDVTPVEEETEEKSLAVPIIIGGIVLTIGYLVMRR